MLKRKRKINKAILIASSRRYFGPLPKAYASLVECGIQPELAQRMVQEVARAGNHGSDSADVWGLCVWSCTSYEAYWRQAGQYLDHQQQARRGVRCI